MRRLANPQLSSSGEEALAKYREVLWEHEDLTDASRRNYLSDLRHFAAWYEANSTQSANETALSRTEFSPQAITTPALIRYRAYLQKGLHQKPNSVNRALISLKRYCGWAIQKQFVSYNPSAPVKLVGEEEHAPRHLEDGEEQALVAVVTNEGTLRDRVLIVLLLHTGLRAREICQLRRDQVKLGKRSGMLEVIGKRNKYREVPLNTTARKVLEEYLSTLPSESISLFPSGKTKEALSERALGYIVKKYADGAKGRTPLRYCWRIARARSERNMRYSTKKQKRRANQEEVHVHASTADPSHSRRDRPRRACSPARGQRMVADAR